MSGLILGGCSSVSVIGLDYLDAENSYTPQTLVSNVRSAAFTPNAGRGFYVKITGSGSAPITLVYSIDDGASFQKMVTGVDGGAPIVLDSLSYADSPCTLSGSVDRAGMQVAVLPGTVTGTVTVEFAQ